jgi:hypothetical protein
MVVVGATTVLAPVPVTVPAVMAAAVTVAAIAAGIMVSPTAAVVMVETPL